MNKHIATVEDVQQVDFDQLEFDPYENDRPEYEVETPEESQSVDYLAVQRSVNTEEEHNQGVDVGSLCNTVDRAHAREGRLHGVFSSVLHSPASANGKAPASANGKAKSTPTPKAKPAPFDGHPHKTKHRSWLESVQALMAKDSVWLGMASENMTLVARALRAAQQLKGPGKPFTFSLRSIAECCGFVSHVTAYRCVAYLVRFGFVDLVERGKPSQNGPSGLANMFIVDLWPPAPIMTQDEPAPITDRKSSEKPLPYRSASRDEL
jgi:hypothetical protein